MSEPRQGTRYRAVGASEGASPQAASRVVVDESGAGQRLDNFLIARLKGVPKSHIYRIVRSGEVRVNSGRVTVAHRLAEGDQVREGQRRNFFNDVFIRF